MKFWLPHEKDRKTLQILTRRSILLTSLLAFKILRKEIIVFGSSCHISWFTIRINNNSDAKFYNRKLRSCYFIEFHVFFLTTTLDRKHLVLKTLRRAKLPPDMVAKLFITRQSYQTSRILEHCLLTRLDWFPTNSDRFSFDFRRASHWAYLYTQKQVQFWLSNHYKRLSFSRSFPKYT